MSRALHRCSNNGISRYNASTDTNSCFGASVVTSRACATTAGPVDSQAVGNYNTSTDTNSCFGASVVTSRACATTAGPVDSQAVGNKGL